MNKYFVYIRKSTDEEDRQVLSIEAQITELKEFTAKEKLVTAMGGIPLGSGKIVEPFHSDSILISGVEFNCC